MRIAFAKSRHRNSQAGVSMIELLIAGMVLVVGCLALVVLVTVAIASNNRNKMDTTGVALAQMVVEEARTLPANSPLPRTLTDCAGTANLTKFALGGASLSGTSINFGAATVPNYNMQWVVCVGSLRSTYDVRWNVQQATSSTTLLTVAVRKKGATSNPTYFALPINVRTILGS